jgi:hypothetical protein
MRADKKLNPADVSIASIARHVERLNQERSELVAYLRHLNSIPAQIMDDPGVEVSKPVAMIPQDVVMRLTSAIENIDQALDLLLPYTTLAAWLKHTRQTRGLSHETISQMTGLSVVVVKKIEEGKIATMEHARALAFGLHRLHPDIEQRKWLKVLVDLVEAHPEK